MCLILASKTGKEISEEHFKNGWDSNPHSGGLMIAKDGKLIIDKGYFKYEDFYEAYKKYIGYPIVIHFRYKTSGLIDKENCHPFPLHYENDEPTIALAHNGVISGFSFEIKDKSDTYSFCNKILQPFLEKNTNKKIFLNQGFTALLGSAIGSNNKLVLMDKDGEISIVNESVGQWVDDEKTVWASNNSYSIIKPRKFNNSTVNYIGYESDWMLSNCRNYYNQHTKDTTENTTQTTKSKVVNNTNITTPKKIDIFKDIPAEELKEIDDYLEILNG